MLARIESGEFSEGTVLLVEAIDRIGRLEHLETEALMNRIIAHGIEIHTLQDGLIYTRDALSDDLGISIIQRVKSYVAHQESKQKSFRVSQKWKQRASDNPLTINIFKGLFRCQCGASVHPTGAKNKYAGVYRCNNHLDGRCDVPPLKRKPFDKWMIDNFLGMIDVGNDGEAEGKIASLQHEVEIVTTRIKKATALLLEMDDITELKTQVKELNQKRTELQTTIDSMRRKGITPT